MAVSYQKLKKPEFKRVFQLGKTIRAGFVFFKILKNKKNYSRLGWIVGTKVSKGSVQRNKIKRRLREILYGLYPNLLPGNDIIVIALPQILNQKYSDIKDDIIDCLKKAKILSI